jgi:hypothetical protein
MNLSPLSMTTAKLARPGRRGDPDAVEIGNLYRRARKSAAESLRLMIEAGQQLLAKKASLPRGQWLLWLEANHVALDMNITSTPQRLMKVAAEAQAQVGGFRVDAEFDDQELSKLNRLVWGNNTRGTEGGEDEWEWYTPKRYIDLARAVLGGIDLDPASTREAQQTVQAKRFYTKAVDGLKQEWFGRVWLNAPFPQPEIGQFVSKLCTERRAGRVSAAILLTNSYTDRDWFHEAISVADAICFTRERIAFENANGTIAAPSHGQAFFYFGKEVALFRKSFKPIGFVLS